MTVEPGVTNLEITNASSHRLLLRAGSIEPVVCSIGGNIAENRRRALLEIRLHRHHVLGVEALPNGDLIPVGGGASYARPGSLGVLVA